jgi:hypothetical protein
VEMMAVTIIIVTSITSALVKIYVSDLKIIISQTVSVVIYVITCLGVL